MVVLTVVCVECGGTRAARERHGETVPFREACPNCGAVAFEPAVDD